MVQSQNHLAAIKRDWRDSSYRLSDALPVAPWAGALDKVICTPNTGCPDALRNDTLEAWEKHGNLLIASNASVKHMHESPHFCYHGSGSFLLVEALPQSPQDTILYSESAAKMQRLRDFSNRLWTLNVLLFRILSPWYAYPPLESCPHLPWQFAEKASHLWPFDSLHTWLFSRTKAERIPLASS